MRVYRWRRLHEKGVIAIEYLLILPLLLACALVILQTTLLVQAWLVVNHAALTAARAAVVVTPLAMRSRTSGHFEGASEIKPLGQSPKHEYVRRATAVALTSISHEWSISTSSASPDLSLAPALASIFAVFPPTGIDRSGGISFGSRSAYALDRENTIVTLSLERLGKSNEHGIVRVTVRYRYFLAIPFADRLFGKPFGGSGWLGSDRYFEFRAEQTLPVDLNPLFPRQQRPGVYFEETVLE